MHKILKPLDGNVQVSSLPSALQLEWVAQPETNLNRLNKAIIYESYPVDVASDVFRGCIIQVKLQDVLNEKIRA